MQWNHRLNITTAVAVISVALASAVSAQAAEKSDRNSADEKHAISVVTDFVNAMVKDANKAAALLADNIVYRSDQSDKDLHHGRDEALKTLQNFSGPNARLKISEIKFGQSVAMAGKDDILVLQYRDDVFSMGGNTISIPLAAFFRVNPKTWLIEEWLDAPLTRPQGMRGPPPGGGA